MSHRKPAGQWDISAFLHKHHQYPLAQGPESVFVFEFLLRIESHCDSVRDKSRCVLASPAAASIATRACTVSSMRRVIWLKNKQQSPEEKLDSWPVVDIKICRIVNKSCHIKWCYVSFSVFATWKQELKLARWMYSIWFIVLINDKTFI